jgi:DNA/RNA-binding protein KIN17
MAVFLHLTTLVGLQKLKFYCQMCSKQCRDENGFKCHLTSDSHLRSMKLFRENVGGIMDDFSREFENAYVETLRRRHGTQRMNANNVYQEVIQDKHHVHMNSTKWTTLTDFVQYLGKKGICLVEETERGWYVTYIERDPALLARQEALKKKMEADRKEELVEAGRRELRRLEAAKALDRMGGMVEMVASEIGEREGGQIELKIGQNSAAVSGKKRKNVGKISLMGQDDEEDGEADEKGIKADSKEALAHSDNDLRRINKSDRTKPNHKRGNDQSEGQESNKKQKRDAKDDGKKDYWLRPAIVVRIISKSLSSGQYYKRKAVVTRVVEKYTAEVKTLPTSDKANDGGDVLRIDQEDLETVIPKNIDEKVWILNGAYRGKKGRIVKLDKKNYCADVRLSGEDRTMKLDYEDISMIA